MKWHNEKTLVVAHRGAASEAPENTMAALRLALEQQCNAIELDIHLTQDGEIVVCHDETLDRTTNLRGGIGEMTLTDIRQADAALGFPMAMPGSLSLCSVKSWSWYRRKSA